jgi:hypothetical protein
MARPEDGVQVPGLLSSMTLPMKNSLMMHSIPPSSKELSEMPSS